VECSHDLRAGHVNPARAEEPRLSAPIPGNERFRDRTQEATRAAAAANTCASTKAGLAARTAFRSNSARRSALGSAGDHTRPKPYVLDDATIVRTKRVNGEGLEWCDVYDRQLRRWRSERLTGAQRREVARLQGVTGELRIELARILELADELERGARRRQLQQSLLLARRAAADDPGGLWSQRFTMPVAIRTYRCVQPRASAHRY
jgi:hypothetical protein